MKFFVHTTRSEQVSRDSLWLVRNTIRNNCINNFPIVGKSWKRIQDKFDIELLSKAGNFERKLQQLWSNHHLNHDRNIRFAPHVAMSLNQLFNKIEIIKRCKDNLMITIVMKRNREKQKLL